MDRAAPLETDDHREPLTGIHPLDIVILSNGPGEVATWVRPVVRELRRRWGDDRQQLRLSLVLSPCTNASGQEVALARRYPELDRIQGPEAFFPFLLTGKTAENWDWRSRGVVIFLGGDQAFAVVVGKRLGYRIVVYGEWMALWPRWVDAFGVMSPQLLHQAPPRYRHKYTLVGDLMAEAAEDPAVLPQLIPNNSTATLSQPISTQPISTQDKVAEISTQPISIQDKATEISAQKITNNINQKSTKNISRKLFQDSSTQDSPTQDFPDKDSPNQDSSTQDFPDKDSPTQDSPENPTLNSNPSLTLTQISTPHSIQTVSSNFAPILPENSTQNPTKTPTETPSKTLTSNPDLNSTPNLTQTLPPDLTHPTPRENLNPYLNPLTPIPTPPTPHSPLPTPQLPPSPLEQLALLPGSKPLKLKIGVPLGLAIAQRLQELRPQVRWFIPVAPTLTVEELARYAQRQHNPLIDQLPGVSAELIQPPQGNPYLQTPQGTIVELDPTFPAYDRLRQCHLCLTTLGANTAELGALGVPMVVGIPTNRLDLMKAWDGLPGLVASLPGVGPLFARWFNERMIRRLGLMAWPNIWAGEMIVPEVLDFLTAETMAQLLLEYLRHPERLQTMRDRLRQVRGEPGAARRLGEIVAQVVRTLD